MVVSGIIEVPVAIQEKKFSVHISLLDTSFADAPATWIAGTTTHYTGKKENKKATISFELQVDASIETSHDYSMAVLFDLDEDGAISANDYIHRQAYTAIRGGIPQQDIFIAVQKV